MAETKMTKRNYFEVLKNEVVENGFYYENEDITKDMLMFINHEIELLNRKSNKTTETKVQKENMTIKNTIREVLRSMDHAVTITEMQADKRLAGYSNQKLSALVRQMSDVVKTTEKKKSYFALAE